MLAGQLAGVGSKHSIDSFIARSPARAESGASGELISSRFGFAGFPEDGERLDEGAAADDDLRVVVTHKVENSEVLVDAKRIVLVRSAIAARTTAGEETAKSSVSCSPSANRSRPQPLRESGVTDDIGDALVCRK